MASNPTLEQAALTMGAIAVCIQTPGSGGSMGLPILLWGPPGVGKTARINQLAVALGFHLTTVLASIRGAEDFLGLPGYATDPTTGEQTTVFIPPKWARDFVALNPRNIDFYTGKQGRLLAGTSVRAPAEVTKPGPPGLRPPGLPLPPTVPLAGVGARPTRGLLFLDEITTAPPTVMAALLRVIHERVVGDIDLPSTTAVIAAANPPEQAAGAAEPLAPPLANRFIHLDWPEPDPIEWSRWLRTTAAQQASGALDEEIQKINAAAERYFLSLRLSYESFAATYSSIAAAAGDFFGIVASRGRELPYLFNFPEGDDEATGRAWPSPRSWELGLRGYAAAESLSQLDIGRHILVGAVGETSAFAFFDHLATAKLPQPGYVLTEAAAGRLRFTPDPARGSADFLHVNRIVSHAVNTDPSLGSAAWDYLALLHGVRAPLDVIHHAYKILMAAKIPPSPKAHPLIEAMHLRLGPAMATAGVV